MIKNVRTGIFSAWPRHLVDDGGDEYYLSEADDGAPHTLKSIFECLELETCSAKDFGLRIGYTASESERILSELYFRDSPLMTDMYYGHDEPESQIENDYYALLGHYDLDVDNSLSIEKFRVDIRYIFEANEFRNLIKVYMETEYNGQDQKGRPAVIIDKYDGWVRVVRTAKKNHHAIWMFQKRRKAEIDFAFFVTEAPSIPNRGDKGGTDEEKLFTLQGEYLTIRASGGPRTGKVVFRKRSRKRAVGRA